MCKIPEGDDGCKPFGSVCRSILSQIIASAENEADQKAFILAGYESGYLSIPETFALIHVLGLATS